MKTKYILSGALLSLLAASCTDLDVDIKSTYTEFPGSEIAFESKTADAYFAFRGAIGRRFDEGNSCNSDEYTAISFGGDYLNGRDMANFSLHTISPSASDAQLGVYSDLTSGITKCNQLLYVDLADLGGEDSELGAPVRAARAFYTFVLMDHWGDTPILDHIIADDEAIARSPRAEVARWIESELLAVRDKCPAPATQDASTYGKPTRWMVDALLAKLYINWPVYVNDVTSSSWTYGTNEKLADCIAVCDDVIQHGPFDLSDDYVKKFQYNNSYKIKDFIYVMPFDCVNQQGLTYGRFRTWRQANKPGRMYDPAMSNSCGGNMALTPEFVELFNLPGDRRNDVILGGDIYVLNGTTGEATSVRATYDGVPLTFTKTISLVVQDGDLDCGKDLNGWCQGYRSVKFAPYVPEYNSYSRNQSNDVPIFRYADIILMKAEAILRGGSATNGDTAVSLFNQIRSYVGAPTVESIDLQDVEDERGREFLDEHWRRNDLIRFGHFERKWGFKEEFGSSDPRMRLWPLGQSTLNSNANWTQNAGY